MRSFQGFWLPKVAVDDTFGVTILLLKNSIRASSNVGEIIVAYFINLLRTILKFTTWNDWKAIIYWEVLGGYLIEMIDLKCLFGAEASIFSPEMRYYSLGLGCLSNRLELIFWRQTMKRVIKNIENLLLLYMS